MKKINYLWLFGLLSIMALGFAACSDDDDEGLGSSTDLVGPWKLVNGYYVEKKNGTVISEEEDDGSDDERFIFMADGGFKSYINGRLSDDGTWTYKSGNIHIMFNDEYEEEYEDAKVLELTKTTLTIEYSETEKAGGTTYEYYAKETYRKVTD